MHRKLSAWAATLIVAAGTSVAIDAVRAESRTDDATIARGRYLTQTSGCNDCHTPGYMENNGRVPESEWLTGASVGFQGPWGTSYPANLRLMMQSLSEEAWLHRARAPMRPPMPWFNLAAMNDDDLRALYRYVLALGPKGEPAPRFVAPGEAVTTPVFVFVPQQPAPRQQAAR